MKRYQFTITAIVDGKNVEDDVGCLIADPVADRDQINVYHAIESARSLEVAVEEILAQVPTESPGELMVRLATEAMEKKPKPDKCYLCGEPLGQREGDVHPVRYLKTGCVERYCSACYETMDYDERKASDQLAKSWQPGQPEPK